MDRQYDSGSSADATFFTGLEVEKTPAYGLRTLFVVGVQDFQKIEAFYSYHHCEHIFFGANHSFDPKTFEEWEQWEELIGIFLKKGYLCSLDIPLSAVEEFHDSGLCSYDNFVPQIRVPIPYIGLWNYNTMVKIDDKGFKNTNPGVWCHTLHELQDHEKFTSWHRYTLDTVIE